MTRITCILSRVFLMTIAIGSFAATSQAGYVALSLIVDPPTTAGAGIPTIARANSTGTFSVTSNKSGAGSWHLYALDTGIDSFGIAYFKVGLNGTLSNVFNRSPIASFDTLDDEGGSVEGGSGNAGFSLGLLRTAVPVQGAQEVGSANRIGGLGQTASNFNNTPNLPAVPSGGSRLGRELRAASGATMRPT